MFNFSLYKKNMVSGILAIAFVFLVAGLAISLVAAGLLLSTCGFYWFFNKLNNNLIISGIFTFLFSIVSLILHGPYLTACFFVIFFTLLLSFNALYILVKDMVEVLWIILVTLIIFSFLPPSFQIHITFGWLAIMGLISAFKVKVSRENAKCFLGYIQNSISWFDLLTIFFILLTAIALAFVRGGYFWALDSHHPIYELSIGQSYRNVFLNVPDLSYSGKLIRFHFLSTQIPFYFSNVFQIPLLDALYTVLMLFFSFISLLLIQSFFYIYPKLKTPLFFLFFVPSFIFIMDCIYRATLLATASFFLAFLFMICALHFLICHRYLRLLLCSMLLLLIKASFFMSLCGGIFIFWIRQRYGFLKFLLKCLPFAVFFLLINYFFLSGAHGHNLWVFMPSFMFHYTRESYFFCRTEAFLGLLVFVSVLYLLMKDEDEKIQALSAIVASGLIGWLFLAELSEANSYQFVRATYFPLCLLIWYLLFNKFNNFMNFVFKNVPDYSHQVAIFFNKFCFVGLLSMCLCYSASFLLQSAVMVADVFRHNKYCVTTELISAYAWICNNVLEDSVVLFGLHYSVGPDFIRSAISGKQLYCEGFKAKGILMEKDYVSRVANITLFYKHFVNSSNLSKQLLASFESTGSGGMPGIPLSKSPAFFVRMLHYLSFGKEWHFMNRSKQVKFELGQALEKDFTQVDALNFIKQAKITHIILENGDRPSDFLVGITNMIYNDGDISVFKVLNN